MNSETPTPRTDKDEAVHALSGIDSQLFYSRKTSRKIERDLAAQTDDRRAAEEELNRVQTMLAAVNERAGRAEKVVTDHLPALSAAAKRMLDAERERDAATERAGRASKHSDRVSNELGLIAAMVCREPGVDDGLSEREIVDAIMRERDAARAEVERLRETLADKERMQAGNEDEMSAQIVALESRNAELRVALEGLSKSVIDIVNGDDWSIPQALYDMATQTQAALAKEGTK